MADPNRWFNAEHVAAWNADPGRNNPTRAEQVDILAELAAAAWTPGTAMIDLACGTGHVIETICERCPEARVVALDYSPQVLETARQRLALLGDAISFVEADLTALASAALPEETYSVAISVQSFHHFQDDEKARQVAAIHDHLAPGGVLLVQDRFEVPGPGLYDLYQTLWRRQRRIHQVDVNDETLPDLTAPPDPMGEKAAALPWFLDLLRDAGFEAACLHLHGTRGLVAARKPHH